MADDTRNVTITFEDGTNHNYEKVPKTVSPDEIEQRASKEFSGKKIKNISGGSAPTSIDTTPSESSGNLTLGQKVKKIGEEAVSGGVLGYMTPEILTYGVAPVVGFFAPPAAPFIAATGQAMKAARIPSMIQGAIGGATGETAGQIAESKYGAGTEANIARLAGSVLGPSAIDVLGTGAGKVFGSALSFLPGMKTAKTVGQLLQEADVKPENITQKQKEFIEQQIAAVRGGKSSLEAQKEIYQMLKSGAKDIETKAKTEALNLEQEAQSILSDVQNKIKGITPDLEKRINNLQSQLNISADKIRSEATEQGKKIIQESEKRASQIRENSKGKSDTLRQLSEIDAKEAIAEGRRQADALVKQAQAQSERLRKYRDQVINIRNKYATVPAKEAAKIGKADLPTERGNLIRQGFMNVVESIKNGADNVIEYIKKPVFDFALNKEKQGFKVENTESFKRTLADIKYSIQNPETGLTDIPVTEIKSTLNRIQSYLDPRVELEGEVIGKPVSFQGLDILRRYLRDRASGLPAEGFDAISQQQAKLFADKVDNIMEEFSPGFKAYKEAYANAMRPLNELRTKFGRAVTDKPEGYDVGLYMRDAASLGAEAFKSAGTVKQLIDVLGPQQAEQIARGFIADELKSPTATNIKNLSYKIRDWIGQFPRLQQDLAIAEQNVSKAEKITGKGETLSKVLRTKLQTVPKDLLTAAERAEKDALLASEKIVQKGELEASRIEKPGETQAERTLKAGETLAERKAREAESQITTAAGDVAAQRGRMEAEAEAQRKLLESQGKAAEEPLTQKAKALLDKAKKDADLILKGTTDADRVRDILLSKNADEWEAASKIILATPNGKEKFAEAVGQIIADRAEKSLKGAIEDMKYIGNNLQTYGLMNASEVATIQNKLQEIFVMPISNIEKISMAKKFLRNTIIGSIQTGMTDWEPR